MANRIRQALRRFVPAITGAVLVMAMVATRVLLPDPFSHLQLYLFDTLQRLHPWQPESSRVAIVDVDEDSLRRVGQWPWPRTAIATMVDRLREAGASAIVFDMIFAEPDRTSPAGVAADWSRRFGWQSQTTALPDYDQQLAEAFGRGRVVAGIGLVSDPNGARPILPASFATIGPDPALTVSNYRGAVPVLPLLGRAAAGAGSVSVVGGADQVVRALPLIAALNGALVPTLSLEAVRVAADEDTVGVRAEHDGFGGPLTGYTVKVGDIEVPVDPAGAVLLHDGPSPGRATVSAWRLLDADPATAAAAVRGRVVLIGTSAVGLVDLRATPLNPLTPGVLLHARGIEQMMAGHYLVRPAWAPGAEMVAAVLLGAAAVALAASGRLLVAAGLTGLVVVLAFAAPWLSFARSGLLFDPSLIGLTVVPGAVGTALMRYFGTERDALRLRSAFKHYLSPDLVDVLAREPDRLKLGGELREMSFVFTDLEGFTSLMEAADPAAAVSLLNGYLDGLCRIAIAHGGTVDKIVGDALHVMFNAPLDQPDHPARAVRCALAIDGFAQDFAIARRAEGLPFGSTRIGVNTGQAVVGNFGGSRRFDYTAHGDAINTAARLEAANKTLGTRVCIAASTAAHVTDLAFLPVGTLMLKGKSRGVEVFVPALEGAEWQDAYRFAYQQLEAGDEVASLAILALHQQTPDHPVLALHAKRFRSGERTMRLAA